MSLVDYSSLESEISNAQEPKILNVGSEVKARIVSVKTGISEKNDCRWYNIMLDVPEDPMVVEFNAFFWELDKEKLDPKSFARTLNDFKNFAKCFSLDYSRPFDWIDDLPGLEGWIIVGVKKDDYGEKNTVKKYVVGR